jgi:hypothetical protein
VTDFVISARDSFRNQLRSADCVLFVYFQTLVAANNLKGKIVVIPGKIEEITLPELVDVIISEPMGYMLYNERMLETYLHAKKWLLPSGVYYYVLEHYIFCHKVSVALF